jgi:hypothetical protein
MIAKDVDAVALPTNMFRLTAPLYHHALERDIPVHEVPESGMTNWEVSVATFYHHPPTLTPRCT